MEETFRAAKPNQKRRQNIDRIRKHVSIQHEFTKIPKKSTTSDVRHKVIS